MICPELLTDLERHREDVSSVLGPVPGGVIDFFLYRDAADLAANSPCVERAGGCAIGSGVHVPSISYVDTTITKAAEHELIHGYFSDAGEGPGLLVEGLAEAISCTSTVMGGVPRESLHWTEAVRSNPRDLSRAEYIASRLFVYRMLQRFGPSSLLSYYREALDTRSPALFAVHFQRTFGVSVDEIWAEAAAEQGAAAVCPCTGEGMAIDGAALTIAPSCGVRQRVLEVTSEDTLLLASSAIYGIGRCDGAAPRPPHGFLGSVPGGRGQQALMKPAPGRYYLDLGSGDAVTLSATRGTWVSARCDLSAPFRIDGTNGVEIAVPASGDRWFVPIAADVAFTARARREDGAGTASLCSACDLAPDGCVTVGPEIDSVAVPAGQIAVLTVATQPSYPGRIDAYHVVTLIPTTP